MDKITIYLDFDVASDLKNILVRETESYTHIDKHLPDRIKNIRFVIGQLTTQLHADD